LFLSQCETIRHSHLSVICLLKEQNLSFFTEALTAVAAKDANYTRPTQYCQLIRSKIFSCNRQMPAR
ncbi:hypothetical protein, partial [uncultured Kingella sp.]|uniref:hypothetical protein n=1 Tax=uncultured Kingella sp. TaxID=159270 RepID=UPI0025964806